MPVIACPGCGKQYKLPATAAGQVAKCACGKRFRLGPARAPASAATPQSPSQTRPQPKPQPKATTKAPSPPPPTRARSADPVAAVAASDAFWDDVLSEESAAKPAAAAPSAAPTSLGVPLNQISKPAQPQQPDAKPKKRKKKKIRWGFQWEKVIGGGATFLIAGAITIGLLVTTGYLFYWPAGIAIVGLFTMLSGLMGEEGIW